MNAFDDGESKLGSAALAWTLLVTLTLGVVLVPWLIWGDVIEAWVSDALVERQPPPFVAWWIVGLLAADVFLPVPSSIVAVAAGVFLGWAQGAAVAFLGLTMGAVMGYAFGRYGGAATARRVVGEREWQRAETWAQRYGTGLVLFLRPVPVLAEASTFYVGASRVPFVRYLVACSLGNSIIAVAYASVGSFTADSGELEPALMAGFLLPGVAMMVVRLIMRRWQREEGKP